MDGGALRAEGLLTGCGTALLDVVRICRTPGVGCSDRCRGTAVLAPTANPGRTAAQWSSTAVGGSAAQTTHLTASYSLFPPTPPTLNDGKKCRDTSIHRDTEIHKQRCQITVILLCPKDRMLAKFFLRRFVNMKRRLGHRSAPNRRRAISLRWV